MKSKRGGKRKGAGRKTKFEMAIEKAVSVSFTLYPSQQRKLEAIVKEFGGTRSTVIGKLIDRFAEKKLYNIF